MDDEDSDTVAITEITKDDLPFMVDFIFHHQLPLEEVSKTADLVFDKLKGFGYRHKMENAMFYAATECLREMLPNMGVEL